MATSLTTLINTILPDQIGEQYDFITNTVKDTLRDFCSRTQIANRGIVQTIHTTEIDDNLNNSVDINTLASGTYLDDDCDTIADWTDGDTGTGASTAATLDNKDTFKMDSGASAGAGNYARLYQTLTDNIPSKFCVSAKLYHDLLGTQTAGDYFELLVQRAGVALNVQWCSDGLYINSGSMAETGTNIVLQKTWQQWDFIVTATTPASATVDVYLDGILQTAAVDCSYTGTFTANVVDMFQKGTATANCITYVADVKIGNPNSYMGWQPCGVIRCTVDGEDYQIKQRDISYGITDIDDIEENYLKWWYLSNPSTIRIFPFDDDSERQLHLQIAFMPTDSISELDDNFYRQWYEVIKAGALSRLLAIPSRTFKDLKLAPYYQRQYEEGINGAMTTVFYDHYAPKKKIVRRI